MFGSILEADVAEQDRVFIKEEGEGARNDSLRGLFVTLGAVPFGLLVWSTGLAPNPLITSIKDFKHDQASGGCVTLSQRDRFV